MKIDIFKNGSYLCSTTQARTCCEAMRNIRKICKTGRPLYVTGLQPVIVGPGDRLTARFDRRV